MRLTSKTCLTQTRGLLSLDWESLGRLVRRATLEAVAAHFAAIGIERRDASKASGDRPSSSGGRA